MILPKFTTVVFKDLSMVPSKVRKEMHPDFKTGLIVNYGVFGWLPYEVAFMKTDHTVGRALFTGKEIEEYKS